MVEFRKDVTKLSDADLPRYKDHLFDRILGVIATEEFRLAVLDKIEEVDAEIKKRQTHEESNPDSSGLLDCGTTS